MSAGIKRRICQHGYPVEHDAVKQSAPRCISSPSAFVGLTILIFEKQRTVFIAAGNRGDCIIWADHRAHAASYTAVGHGSSLPDAGEVTVVTPSSFAEYIKLGHALPHMR